MPYKCERIKLPERLDRRIKLLREQKSEICLLRHCENLSQRKLARMFGVSRRTIQFVLDPEKLEANKKARELRGGWALYYDAEKHRDYVKGHRRYKHGLLRAGLISAGRNHITTGGRQG